MAYIDTTYINALADDAVVDAFFTDIGDASINSAALTQAIATAESVVKSALANAGYSVPGAADTPPEIVKTATFGVFIKIMYGRKQLEVPEQYADVVNLVERIRSGDVTISELAVTGTTAVGGVDFSESATGVTDSRVPVFSRKNMGCL